MRLPSCLLTVLWLAGLALVLACLAYDAMHYTITTMIHSARARRFPGLMP